MLLRFPRALLSWFRCIAAVLICAAPAPVPAAGFGDDGSVLLVAAEEMQDPRFRQTVVLVTRHGRRGAPIGVVFNRAFDVTLDRLFPHLEKAAGHRLHYGGPVDAGRIVFLVRGEAAPSGAIAIDDKLYLASDARSLLRLLDAPTTPAQLRVFSGFASWAPDQLESEIERGNWHVLPIDAEALFSAPLEALWPALLSRATQVMVRAPALCRRPAA